ncbi:Phosphohydrolase incomplete domain containing protein [Pandoravirus celtis]|uniref:Phosphohydrolase incomplete domain containing protein n=1 Tax=Pandoravirus celtis TaxID=2568002 RepID=A0A4D6EFI1_9VIRU|nr:Phosphohydrolase incomplete domain containing protein [Pandoravirus celtis]
MAEPFTTTNQDSMAMVQETPTRVAHHQGARETLGPPAHDHEDDGDCNDDHNGIDDLAVDSRAIVQMRRPEEPRRRMRRYKMFKDPIHGLISLPIGLVKFIDTPEFQRLRRIKQLAACYLVYDGATHTRFEHSLGTCHMAGRWMAHFVQQQAFVAERLAGLRLKAVALECTIDRAKDGAAALSPDALADAVRCLDRTRLKIASLEDRIVAISKDDVFLVQVAALCHDLGHGPFSHAFEQIVNERPRHTRWHHEEISCALVRRINERVGVLTADEVERVEAMIRGHVLEERRAFLYRVVHNALNSVDADKFDYLLRDSHATGMQVQCDADRLIAYSRIEGGEICFRESEYSNLLRMFRSRLDMHRQVYSHPVGKAVELMIGDVLRDAEGALGLFAAIERDDPDAFLASTDDILGEIRRRAACGERAFGSAAALLDRIDRHDLYVSVAEIRMPSTDEAPAQRVLPTVWAVLAAVDLSARARVVVVTLDYAMGTANPLKRVPFYESEWHPARAGGSASSEAFEAAVPDLARGSTVHVYATTADAVAPVRGALDRWNIAIGLREGYRLLVSPKLQDLPSVRR